MKRIGIIGCGAVASLIAEAVDRKIVQCEELILLDSSIEKAQRLQASLETRTKVVSNIDEMLNLRPTVIIEAASQEAVRDYLGKIVDNNIDLIVMSVGALLFSKVKSRKIHTTSGAIGGLDAISNAELAGIDKIVLTTRKHPKTLDMDNTEEKLVYEGNVYEAVRRFPRELNVAASLALTAQPDKVFVRVISDPNATRNTHELSVKWKYGEMFMRFMNDPHPENPKTSALAAWAAIRLLKNILEVYV